MPEVNSFFRLGHYAYAGDQSETAVGCSRLEAQRLADECLSTLRA